MTSVLALDLSLTSTGVAYSSEVLDQSCRIRPKTKGADRLSDIRDEVLIYAGYRAGHPVDLVVIEGYSHGSGYQAHQMGELGGVIRLALHDAGVPWVTIPPASVKRLACGAGNAKKEQVLLAAVRRLGYLGDSNDEADALWLLEAARQHYQLPGRATLPAAHLTGLAKVDWPDLGGGL